VTRRNLGLVLSALALLTCSASAQNRSAAPAAVVVRDAWIRQTSMTRTVSSGYATIENRTGSPIALVKVTVEGAGTAELHGIVDEGGRATMKPIARVPVPPGGSAALAPGGTHVMLSDVSHPMKVGTTVQMSFVFDNGRTVRVRAVVRPLDAMTAK
jgi:copper(I)-binding protein